MNTFISTQRLHFLLLLSAALLAAFSVSACDSTEPDDHGAGDEELITRIQLTLTSSQAPQTVVEASDPDGDGANLAIGTLVLKAGVTYSGMIDVFDDVNDENVGAEISEEADEHQFFFTAGGTDGARLTIATTDSDSNGLPVGRAFTIATTAGGAGQATLQVVLSHFDDVPKDGVSQSDETDIDVLFPVTIQP